MTTQYRCAELAECSRALAGELFERKADDDLKCPGCGKQLVPVGGGSPGGARSSGGSAGKFAAIGAAVVLLAGGGWFMTRSGSTPAPVAASAAPAASPSGQGLAPSDADLAKQKQEGQAALAGGQASAAESSSTKAAANEMVKAGIARMAMGKLDEAEKSFRAAIDIDPKQSLAYYNVGILRLRQGRTDDALKEFEASFMAGFSYFDKLEQDTDLDPIRKDPRFVELLARYKGR